VRQRTDARRQVLGRTGWRLGAIGVHADIGRFTRQVLDEYRADFEPTANAR